MKQRSDSTQNSVGTASDRMRGLTPFPPGQSGNPGGRPKKKPISDYLKEHLEATVPAAMLDGLKPQDRAAVLLFLGDSPTMGAFVAYRTIQQTLKGDVPALREVLDRVEGKVAARVTGEDAGPIQFVITRAGRKGYAGD